MHVPDHAGLAGVGKSRWLTAAGGTACSAVTGLPFATVGTATGAPVAGIGWPAIRAPDTGPVKAPVGVFCGMLGTRLGGALSGARPALM